MHNTEVITGLTNQIRLLLMAIILAGLSQCMPYRTANVDRATKVRQSQAILKESQQNFYASQKIREFLNQIKYYLGTPYRYGGQTRQGMDCSGFVMVVYRESFDLKLPHNAYQIYRACEKIPRQRLQLGDLVFFRNRKNKKIDHVGIYLAKDYFVHASVSQGVVASQLTEKYYRLRFAGAGRLLSLDTNAFDDHNSLNN